jgi:hypothetical protein
MRLPIRARVQCGLGGSVDRTEVVLALDRDVFAAHAHSTAAAKPEARIKTSLRVTVITEKDLPTTRRRC